MYLVVLAASVTLLAVTTISVAVRKRISICINEMGEKNISEALQKQGGRGPGVLKNIGLHQ